LKGFIAVGVERQREGKDLGDALDREEGVGVPDAVLHPVEEGQRHPELVRVYLGQGGDVVGDFPLTDIGLDLFGDLVQYGLVVHNASLYTLDIV